MQASRLAVRVRSDRIVLVGVLAVAAALVLTRPLNPWWLTADCDATYLGSALNLYAGYPTEKFDHPGMPLQVLLTLTVAADHAARRVLARESTLQYVDAVFTDMSRGTWMVRGWGVAFFLFGVGIAFEIGRRLGGHWMWGAAAAMLYGAAPGHVTHAATFRPANVLSPLCMLITYWLTLGHRKGSIGFHLAAVALLGFAMTVKVHAVGMFLPVLVGLWFVRDCDWPAEAKRRMLTTWRRHRRGIALTAICFVAGVAATNRSRNWTDVDVRVPVGIAALVGSLVVTCRYWQAGSTNRRRRWIVNPMWSIAALVGLAGMLIPNLFFIDELVPMLRVMWWSITGQGHNAGFELSSVPTSLALQWSGSALCPLLPIVALAALGAWRAVRRRDTAMLYWLIAAGSMFALATMRGVVHPSPHHYGPALALAIPLVLSLCGTDTCGAGCQPVSRQLGTASLSMLGPRWRIVGIIALTITPIASAQLAAWDNHNRCVTIDQITKRLTPRLTSNEFIMTDYWGQNADAAHFMQVRDYCFYTPAIHYRSLPDAPTALRYAKRRGLTPIYYITFGSKFTQVEPDDAGRLIATSVWGDTWRVELLESHPTSGTTVSVYQILEEKGSG